MRKIIKIFRSILCSPTSIERRTVKFSGTNAEKQSPGQVSRGLEDARLVYLRDTDLKRPLEQLISSSANCLAYQGQQNKFLVMN